MARAHQHAAVLGDQREDMAGPDEVGGAHIAVGKSAHRVGALLGRDAGGQAVADVDRDGEGGAERRIVLRHHRIEPQARGFVAGQRRADDAAAMADDERHLLRRAMRGGDDQVALVLAVVVIDHDHDLAAGEGATVSVTRPSLHGWAWRPRRGPDRPRKSSRGRTTPLVAAAMASALSREIEVLVVAVAVMLAGEPTCSRREVLLDFFILVSQGISFMCKLRAGASVVMS